LFTVFNDLFLFLRRIRENRPLPVEHCRERWVLESGTICRRTSDNPTCHTAVFNSRWRHCHLVSGTKAQCETAFNCAL